MAGRQYLINTQVLAGLEKSMVEGKMPSPDVWDSLADTQTYLSGSVDKLPLPEPLVLPCQHDLFGIMGYAGMIPDAQLYDLSE